MTDLLPPELGGIALLVVIAASGATSMITAIFGLGGGLILLAVLATILPPAVLIPVHGLVQLGSNAGRTLAMWRHVMWPGLSVPCRRGHRRGARRGGRGHVATTRR